MKNRVGGEVDAFCTRCRLTLAHTVLAMVGSKLARVRCNTCGGDHAFRGEPGVRPSSTPRAPRAERVVVGFEQLLGEKDLSQARRYSPRETFAVGEVLDHPSFGLGIVQAVRGDKVDVSFKASGKTLVHGRAPPPAASSEAEKPRSPDPSPSGPTKEPVAV